MNKNQIAERWWSKFFYFIHYYENHISHRGIHEFYKGFLAHSLARFCSSPCKIHTIIRSHLYLWYDIAANFLLLYKRKNQKSHFSSIQYKKNRYSLWFALLIIFHRCKCRMNKKRSRPVSSLAQLDGTAVEYFQTKKKSTH